MTTFHTQVKTSGESELASDITGSCRAASVSPLLISAATTLRKKNQEKEPPFVNLEFSTTPFGNETSRILSADPLSLDRLGSGRLQRDFEGLQLSVH